MKKCLHCLTLLMIILQYGHGQQTPATNFALKKGKPLSSNATHLSFIDDLDGNAYSELINVSPTDSGDADNMGIEILDIETMFVLHLEPVWAKLLDVKACDLTGNGRKEMVYAFLKGDSIFLKVYDPFRKGRPLWIEKVWVVKRRFLNRPWHGGAHIGNFADLNHDGYPEIVLILSAAYDRYPRAIMAYDFYHRKKLWEFPVANTVHFVMVADVTGDGRQEIFFDTGAPGNGTRVDGMDDFHSYFFVLNENGRLLYHQEMGGENSNTIPVVAQFPPSGRPALFTLTVTSNMQEYRDNRFIKWGWDADGHLFPEKVNDALRFGSWPVVLPFRGVPSFFVSDAQFRLCVLDSNLKLIQVLPLQEKFGRLYGEFDVNRDGVKEYIWETHPNQRAVLSRDFELLGTMPPFTELFEIEQGRGRPTRLAMLLPHGEFFEFRLEPRPFYYVLIKKKWWAMAGVLLMVNLLIWFWLAARTGNWKWYRKQLSYFDTSLSAVYVLDLRGRVAACNRKAANLLGKSQNDIIGKKAAEVFSQTYSQIAGWIDSCWKQLRKDQRQFQLTRRNSRRTIQAFFQIIKSRLGITEGAVLILNDLTLFMQSQQTAAWLTVSQKLAHEVKNPLSTIGLTLQRIKYEFEDDPETLKRIGEFLDGSLEEVNRLRQVLDDFMRFSRVEKTKFSMLNLREIVEDVVERFQLNLPDRIDVKVEIAEELPQIYADSAQIYTLFSNLIDNAAQAIQPPGEICIRLNLNEKVVAEPDHLIEEEIEIEISDTGHGMDEETLEKIYQPFFTTRKGGSGLGMSIVQRIVKDHNGTIDVFSQKGLGTRIVVRFPVSETGGEIE